MNSAVPRMPPEQAARVRRIEGIHCQADNRELREGEAWYEMQKTGTILCVQHMMQTTTERAAYKGVV